MIKNKPIILIDALGIDKPGGARTAVLYLFKKLIELRPSWHYIIFLSRRELVFQEFKYVRQVVLPVRKGVITRLLIQIIFPILVIILRIDLVHFTKSQGSWVWGSKKVLTLFDTTTLQHPDMYSLIAGWYWKYALPALARYCDAIVTISRDVAKDIHYYMNVPMEKIHVVYCASQFIEDTSATKNSMDISLKRYNLPNRYMLFVGSLSIKKNLKTLINAIAIMRKNGVTFPPLILVGPFYDSSDDRSILTAIENLNLQNDIQYIGQVKQDELKFIYQNAYLLIFPSVHEGFGIPILEAMNFGVPIIASNSSAIPEVVGPAGILVDDYRSSQAWADKIQLLLSNKKLRSELIKRGYKQASLFSWKSSAEELVHLYELLLKI